MFQQSQAIASRLRIENLIVPIHRVPRQAMYSDVVLQVVRAILIKIGTSRALPEPI